MMMTTGNMISPLFPVHVLHFGYQCSPLGKFVNGPLSLVWNKLQFRKDTAELPEYNRYSDLEKPQNTYCYCFTVRPFYDCVRELAVCIIPESIVTVPNPHVSSNLKTEKDSRVWGFRKRTFSYFATKSLWVQIDQIPKTSQLKPSSLRRQLIGLFLLKKSAFDWFR